ncbi:MAG: SDR family oxidoreductase [Candidatus Saccharimonadales bacterium]
MNTVVVTGVSRGLGKFVAEAFTKNGWRVIGTGRSDRPEDLGSSIEYQQFDASDSKAAADFWQQLAAEGEVCLVNNAGGFAGGKLIEAKPEDYERQMQSNYFAGVNMTRGLVQNIKKARIINIISAVALTPLPGMGSYGAAKAASRQFFQSLQKELSDRDYQITNLYPSYIATNGQDPTNAILPEDLAGLIIQLAESHTSLYPTDITILPSKF